MNRRSLSTTLQAAERAARAAGDLLRRELHREKRRIVVTAHDIKLELDVRCQELIAKSLQRVLPEAALLGEEGSSGPLDSDWRWVLDPIDGTVNFTHGIPHACISIALQERTGERATPVGEAYPDGYATRLGLVYDPFTDELWTAASSGPARLNGRPIRAGSTTRLSEAIVALGFAKHRRSLNRMMPVFERLVHRVRKIRITGSAALSLTYVASGRFDGYVEPGVRLWDIAAGGLILQRAGAVYWRRPLPTGDLTYEIVVSGAGLQRALHRMNGHP